VELQRSPYLLAGFEGKGPNAKGRVGEGKDMYPETKPKVGATGQYIITTSDGRVYAT